MVGLVQERSLDGAAGLTAADVPARVTSRGARPTSRRLARVVAEQAAEALLTDDGVGRDGADPCGRLGA